MDEISIMNTVTMPLIIWPDNIYQPKIGQCYFAGQKLKGLGTIAVEYVYTNVWWIFK